MHPAVLREGGGVLVICAHKINDVQVGGQSVIQAHEAVTDEVKVGPLSVIHPIEVSFPCGGDASGNLDHDVQASLFLCVEGRVAFAKGFEELVLKGTTDEALKRFANQLDWPQHLAQKYPDMEAHLEAALRDYFSWSKGNWGIADFLAQCSKEEVPEWLRDAALTLKTVCTPATASIGMADVPVPAEIVPEIGVDGIN